MMATESFLNDPELRRLILPVTRADFEMSAKIPLHAGTPVGHPDHVPHRPARYVRLPGERQGPGAVSPGGASSS